MNKKVLVLFILLTVFLSGCWDVDEPERMYYVHGVGVDFKDGKYEIFVQFVDFTNIAKSEQPSKAPIQAEVGHASGNTMDEAIFKLYHATDQKVFWGHLMYLILSEDVMKNGRVNSVVDDLLRYRETRYQIWLYGTKDSVKDVLLITPLLNKAITLSKIGDPMNSYEQESYIEPINFRKYSIKLNEPSHELAIPLISIKENWNTSKEKNKVIYIDGVAVLSPSGYKGTILGETVDGLQWLSHETNRGEVTFKLDSNEESYLTATLDKIKPKITPVVENGKVRFDISVSTNVTVGQLPRSVKPSVIKKGVEKKVKEDIEVTYKAALEKDIDIYRLSEQLYRQQVKVWKKMEKNGKVELNEHSIRNITVNINEISSGRKSFKATVEEND